MDFKRRLRNYGLWTAVAGLGLIVLQHAGVKVVPAEYWNVVEKVLYILVLLGIVNNPDTKNAGFKDDMPSDAQN